MEVLLCWFNLVAAQAFFRSGGSNGQRTKAQAGSRVYPSQKHFKQKMSTMVEMTLQSGRRAEVQEAGLECRADCALCYTLYHAS